MWKATSLALALVGGASADAATCRSDVFEDLPYTACEVDPAAETLRLWYLAPDGQVFGTFDRLETTLAADGEKLGFTMNGAMYHQDRSPVGLYVEDGKEISHLVTSAGPGNFGMLPNGVFCIGEGWAKVLETLDYDRTRPACRYAAQSGPMLVTGGALHPRFLENGTSRHIRNGVGTRPDGTVVFAISDAPVNFHRFARLFRDRLGTPDALYIDGKVSRLYAPDLGRHDIGFPLGPLVGTVVPDR